MKHLLTIVAVLAAFTCFSPPTAAGDDDWGLPSVVAEGVAPISPTVVIDCPADGLVWMQLRSGGATAWVAATPGEAGTISAESPPPDLVLTWMSGDITVTLNYTREGNENMKQFQKRVVEDSSFWKQVFPPNAAAPVLGGGGGGSGGSGSSSSGGT